MPGIHRGEVLPRGIPPYVEKKLLQKKDSLASGLWGINFWSCLKVGAKIQGVTAEEKNGKIGGY